LNNARIGVAAKYIECGKSRIIFSEGSIDKLELNAVYATGYQSSLFIHSVVLVRKNLNPSGHWEVYLCCSDGVHCVKLDLRAIEYLILLGAKIPEEGGDVTANTFKLPVGMFFSVILDLVYELAVMKGKHTGGQDYNCQDFAIALLEKLGVTARDLQFFKDDRARAKAIYCQYASQDFGPYLSMPPSIDKFADGVFKNGLDSTLSMLSSRPSRLSCVQRVKRFN